jgi:predicted RNase H-like HicB family nuclease
MAEPLRYTVIIERHDAGYGAYVPDLPGCGATGKTEAEVRERIQTAIEIHLRSMRSGGDPIPEPHSVGVTVEVEERLKQAAIRDRDLDRLIGEEWSDSA